MAVYEFGGISQALQKQNISLEDEASDSEEKDVLTNLFSYKMPEVIQEDIKDDDLVVDELSKTHETKNEKEVSKTSSTNTKKKPTKKKEPEDPERLERTVFVGNVATSVTRKMLKKLFLKHGEIESIRIRSVPTADPKIPKKVALIKKEFHSERNTMNAYIVFKDKKVAEKTLEQNGYLLEGHRLRLDICGLKAKHDHKKCLFIGNLSFKIKEEAIHQHFLECGEINDVRVVRDKTTGLGKGFAYVKFKNTESVMFGLKLHGSTLDGRTLRVSRSQDKANITTTDTRNKHKRPTQKHSFGGLRSTSKKDREMGKKMFSSSLSKKPNNALRRIQNKQNKQTVNKHNRNKQRNIQRKVNRPKKK